MSNAGPSRDCSVIARGLVPGPGDMTAHEGTRAVQTAVAALAEGRLVIVVDDADRENEADLVGCAARITPTDMAFMVAHTTGIVCVPMPGDRCDLLGLHPMTSESTELHGTAFTISVDHVSTTTGVSAIDRTTTARALADPATRPRSFRRPGHVFPLRSREGGVLKRAGHTEAAVDLLTLAGQQPVGVISELVATDGSMLGGPELRRFARDHGLPLVSVAALVAYRRGTERLVLPVANASLPTTYGEFRAVAYRSVVDGAEHLALVKGDVSAGSADDSGVLVRMHSECLTGDALGSRRCDCGSQLASALKLIADEGRGVLVYLRGQEGRGIGLGHKLRAYELQEAGLDTVDANVQLGLPIDSREYGIGAQILADLGVRKLRLMSNNPSKFTGIEGHGLSIVGRVALATEVTPENVRYLLAKQRRLGHLLTLGDSEVGRAAIPLG